MEVLEITFLVAGLLLAATLVIVDLRTLTLPDSMNLRLGAAGIAFHWTGGWHYAAGWELAVGALAGAGLLYALRALYLQTRCVEALGLGDVKFMLAAGCWVGLWGVPLLLAIASISTLLAVLLLSALDGLPRTELRRRHIAFGPGLCMALVVVCADMLVGPDLGFPG